MMLAANTYVLLMLLFQFDAIDCMCLCVCLYGYKISIALWMREYWLKRANVSCRIIMPLQVVGCALFGLCLIVCSFEVHLNEWDSTSAVLQAFWIIYSVSICVYVLHMPRSYLFWCCSWQSKRKRKRAFYQYFFFWPEYIHIRNTVWSSCYWWRRAWNFFGQFTVYEVPVVAVNQKHVASICLNYDAVFIFNC